MLQFTEEEFKLRTPENYDRHCSRLSVPLASEHSTTNGINFRSPLNQIECFHVANNQIPQDIMHILFEGIIPLETKLMLGAFINDKNYFTTDILNDRVSNFTYGRVEATTKPPKTIETRHVVGGTKLPLSGKCASRQTNQYLHQFLNSLASQMWTFATLHIG